MKLKLGVVMDPIQSIQIEVDTTFAMLLEAKRQGWPISYMEPHNLFLCDGVAWARTRVLDIIDDASHWYELGKEKIQELHQLDVILMRKDPPVDMEYIYTTQMLELAERKGTLVVNKPLSLRDCNEKLFISWFPQCCPPTIVTCEAKQVRDFLHEYRDIICKPLSGMGGRSIFRVQKKDPNLNVIIEALTHDGKEYMLAQRYIPEIKQGDKRIILIDGVPIPYALARIPAPGETRANIHVGGRGIGVKLTKRDYWICEQIGPVLREKGLLFVGIDVIGDYLTEINVTSPTCVRQLDEQFGINICSGLMDCIVAKLGRVPGG